MICIAESGSTKTVWVFLSDTKEEVCRTESIGLNPFFVDAQEVQDVFTQVLDEVSIENLDAIHFYGAGCSSPDRNKRIHDGLKASSLKPKVHVEHDLLAAARATCQNQPGIACILGTGSNSCLYNGKSIIDNVPAMGFMVGDEGSGTALGRGLIQAWIYREMHLELKQAFETRFDIDKESVLNALYYQPKPNKYLASLAVFCSEHRKEPIIEAIINKALNEFVVRHIKKYQGSTEMPIHFVGSIAYHFKDVLLTQLKSEDLKLGKVVSAPIEELLNYHRAHEV